MTTLETRAARITCMAEDRNMAWKSGLGVIGACVDFQAFQRNKCAKANERKEFGIAFETRRVSAVD